MSDPKSDLILKLGRNRALAHSAIFQHRHPNETPEFHYEMIELWHSRIPKVSIMAFRGGAKSTIAEETFIIGIDYKLFNNAIIVGATEKRAVERLRAIKHELDTNEYNIELFGELGESTARVWNDTEVILGNGVRIIAVGKGQSLRGTKHLQYRPDFCFCDDIEEVEPGQIYEEVDAQKTIDWFVSVLLAALDTNARVRINATPLGKVSLPMVLQNLSQWVTKTYPIEYLDEHGQRTATWPARYPFEWIDAKKDEFIALGNFESYLREYMCQAEDPKAKIFTSDMFKVEPKVRTWHPTYAFYDPARSVKSTSATTGWCVWSWLGRRLIVWDAGGDLWKPDEIVAHLFTVAENFSPVIIGVEEDGLNEFLMQPIRHEMLRRNHLIPVVAYKAPKGKIQFIESLQPFFLAGEVTFAKELPVLRQQFLSFPAGRIDAPNALAYALRMRPGQVIYEDFTSANVSESLGLRQREPTWLALNATNQCTTGVLVQVVNGVMNILADYAYDRDAGAALGDIAAAAALDATPVLRLVVGAQHYKQYDTIGLRGAVAKLPADLKRGGDITQGREEIRGRLRKQVRGFPALQVSTRANWTLNAFSAGYAREVVKGGLIQEDAREGIYKTLMEGLEAFAGLLKIGILDDQGVPNVQVTGSGQRYISALPGQNRGISDDKSFWIGSATTRLRSES